MPQTLVDPAILAEVSKKHHVDEEMLFKMVAAEKAIGVRTTRLKEFKRLLGGEQ